MSGGAGRRGILKMYSMWKWRPPIPTPRRVMREKMLLSDYEWLATLNEKELRRAVRKRIAPVIAERIMGETNRYFSMLQQTRKMRNWISRLEGQERDKWMKKIRDRATEKPQE